MQRNAPDPPRVAEAQKLLRAGRLHEQAKAALRQRIDEDPQDAGALLRLGDLHRRMGNFPAASEAYGRLCALRPGERRASWLHAVTAGGQLPTVPPNGIRAAPFVRIRNFLSHAEREHLLSVALAMRGRFAPAGTGRGVDWKVRLLERRALEVRLHSRADENAWFVRKLREALPKVSTLLRIDGCEKWNMGLSMIVHILTEASVHATATSPPSCWASATFTVIPGRSPAVTCCSTIRRSKWDATASPTSRGSNRPPAASSSTPAPTCMKSSPLLASRTT